MPGEWHEHFAVSLRMHLFLVLTSFSSHFPGLFPTPCLDLIICTVFAPEDRLQGSNDPKAHLYCSLYASTSLACLDAEFGLLMHSLPSFLGSKGMLLHGHSMWMIWFGCQCLLAASQPGTLRGRALIEKWLFRPDT